MQASFTVITTKNSEKCYQIHRQVQPNPWSSRIFEDCLTPPYFAFGVFDSNTPIGYYIGMQTLDEATLMDIGVEPKCQGQGIGQSLLLHLIEQCQLKKISHLWLEVRESNKSAIQLYDKHGFEQVDRRRNYYPTKKGTEDALLMCLYLVGDETYFQQ